MIKEIFDKLDNKQRAQLMYALEHEFSQHVEYAKGKFVGVNVAVQRNMSIQELTGAWSCGTMITKE